jgi:hypothetical protein
MIARFMGGIINSSGIIEKNPDKAPMDVVGYNAFGFLLYDDSWEWIMPVVEKIEMSDPDNSFLIYNNFSQYNNDEFVGTDKLNATYKGVIAVIHSIYSNLN